MAAKKKAGTKGGKKSSMVIRPGTGSGHGVKGGSTKTPTSAVADDRHTLGRKGSVKALT
jgi:hypothetical protein